MLQIVKEYLFREPQKGLHHRITALFVLLLGCVVLLLNLLLSSSQNPFLSLNLATGSFLLFLGASELLPEGYKLIIGVLRIGTIIATLAILATIIAVLL